MTGGKPSIHNPVTEDVKRLVKDDIVGVEDWKRSKTGFLTGASSVKKVATAVRDSVSGSMNRTTALADSLLARDDAPSLPDAEGTAAARFEASVELHGKSQRDLDLIAENTRKGAVLYFGLSVAGLAFGLWTLVQWPPVSVLSVIARFGPLPIALALAFKHLYSNWMVRNRSLGGPLTFLASGDFVPRGKAGLR